MRITGPLQPQKEAARDPKLEEEQSSGSKEEELVGIQIRTCSSVDRFDF